MKRLAQTVSEALSKAPICTVFNPELIRVWPQNGLTRQNAVKDFAEEHGWRVIEYQDGYCAIFMKEPKARK